MGQGAWHGRRRVAWPGRSSSRPLARALALLCGTMATGCVATMLPLGNACSDASEVTTVTVQLDAQQQPLGGEVQCTPRNASATQAGGRGRRSVPQPPRLTPSWPLGTPHRTPLRPLHARILSPPPALLLGATHSPPLRPLLAAAHHPMLRSAAVAVHGRRGLRGAQKGAVAEEVAISSKPTEANLLLEDVFLALRPSEEAAKLGPQRGRRSRSRKRPPEQGASDILRPPAREQPIPRSGKAFSKARCRVAGSLEPGAARSGVPMPASKAQQVSQCSLQAVRPLNQPESGVARLRRFVYPPWTAARPKRHLAAQRKRASPALTVRNRMLREARGAPMIRRWCAGKAGRERRGERRAVAAQDTALDTQGAGFSLWLLTWWSLRRGHRRPSRRASRWVRRPRAQRAAGAGRSNAAPFMSTEMLIAR